jgi:hypothetical protein
MLQSFLIDFFIYFSIAICVISTLISAYIVYHRDSKSREHQFLAIFFVGLGGLVAFYLFLQNPILKEFSYIFQVLSISTIVIGIFLFYYTIAHEGILSRKIFIFCFISLFIAPALCLIFHPYHFIEEWYGFELLIDPWFMILINIIYLSFGFYPVIGLLWMGIKTDNPVLKRKLKYYFVGLMIISGFSIIFFVIIPVLFNIHYLKPIGYFAITIGVIIMALSFKGNKVGKGVKN